MDHRNYSLQNGPPQRPNQYDPVHSASNSWESHQSSSGHYLWTSNSPSLPQPWAHPVQQTPNPDSFQLARNGGLPQQNPLGYGFPPPSLEPLPGDYHLRQFYHPFQRLPVPPPPAPQHSGSDNRVYPDHAVSSRLAGFRPAAHHPGVPPTSLAATSELNSLPNFAPPELTPNIVPQHHSSFLTYPPSHPFETTVPRHHHHHHVHHHLHHHSPPSPTRPMSVSDVPYATRSSPSSSGPRRTIRTRRPVSVRTMNDDDELRPATSDRYPTPLSTDGADEGFTLRQMQLLRGSVATKMVASKATLSSMISVKLDDLPENERSCIICYNDFGVKTPEGVTENPLRLPKCGHVFGERCIKQWFEDSDTCPYCRDKLHSEPRISTNARAFVNLMRMRTANGISGSAGRNDEVYLRLLEAAQLEAAERLRHDRRSPPHDTNGQSRRMRPRRTGLTYPGISHDSAAVGNASMARARDRSPGVFRPPSRQRDSLQRASTGPSEPTTPPYSGPPTIANGSQPVTSPTSNLWPEGWTAPGEADIVANPLQSAHSSSDESDMEA